MDKDHEALPVSFSKQNPSLKQTSNMTINNHRRIQLHGDGFLEDFPCSIARYPYTGEEQLREVIDFERDRFQKAIETGVQEYHRLQRSVQVEFENGVSSPGYNTHPGQAEGANQSSNTLEEMEKPPNECVLFDIPEHFLPTDFLDPSKPKRFARFSFDLTKRLLLARMTTRTHSQVIEEFLIAVQSALADRGLGHSVSRYAGGDIRGEEGSGKQPDLGWGPMPVPQGFPDKPTVTVEVAVSESQEKLERDVRWWLNPARGGANLTVTIKVDRKKPRLTIAKWQRVDDQIERTQQIVISKAQDGQITAADAPLIIPFDLMFRRQAIGDETELLLDEAALEALAGAVWVAQGF